MAQITPLEEPKRFASFLRTVFRQDWVVYAKPAFGGPTQVLRYLGRYTHRVAISNHRLLAFDGERVTFRWKDYAHGNKQRKMTLNATKFLRRFAQHILPRGFVRIRQYGFLAARHRTANLALGRQLLAITPRPQPPGLEPAATSTTWNCPRCGAAMEIGANLTARELADRCKFFDSSVVCRPSWRADVQRHADVAVCPCREKPRHIGVRQAAQSNRRPLADSEPSSLRPPLQLTKPFHQYQSRFQHP